MGDHLRELLSTPGGRDVLLSLHQYCTTRGTLDAAGVRDLAGTTGRGRGGAGFPTGRKWRAGAAASCPVKYVVANGEGVARALGLRGPTRASPRYGTRSRRSRPPSSAACDMTAWRATVSSGRARAPTTPAPRSSTPRG